MPLTRQTLTTELALLGLLRPAARHGYDLYQELARPDGLWAIWRIKQSQLYALLARLEADSLITATLQPQEARPPRKVFRLTRAGQAAYRKWVQTPVAHPRDMRLEFLLKLYFARREGADAAQRLIGAQQAVLQARLLEEQNAAAGVPTTATDAWLVSQFRLQQLGFLLRWLDTCAETLNAGLSQSPLAL